MPRRRNIRLSAILGALLGCGAPSFAADLPARPSVQPVSVREVPGWMLGYRALYVDYAKGGGNSLYE